MKRRHLLPLLGTALLSTLPTAASAQDPAPPPRQPGVLRVVCLGDSLTGDRPGKLYLHQYLKWSDLLALALESRLGTGKAEVFNAGWGGDATYTKGDKPGGLKRVDTDVLPFQPDIAVVLIGGNNYSDKTKSPEEITARYREDLNGIVSKIKGAGIKVLLLQYPEPKAEDMSKVWTHLDDGNPIVAEIAKAQQVPTLELAPAFAEAAKTRPLPTLLNGTDGVHLQPYGEVVLARTVFLKLAELGWVTAAAR